MVHKAHIKLKETVKHPTKMEYVSGRFVEFCKRTDLHGFKYIVMDDLNVVERSCWAIAVCLSIGFAIYFVVTAYRWYARNPIVTVIESTQGAIWDVPFPAVTICSLNVISQRAAILMARNLSVSMNQTEDLILDMIKKAPLLLYTDSADEMEINGLTDLQEILDLNHIDTETFFRELSPTTSCDKLVQRCMWKNTIYRCEQLFQHIFTSMGLCCTFNYHAVQDNINSDNLELLRMSAPRRVASCGYQTALTVLLKTDIEDYFSSATASLGSMVFIENAFNVPDLDSSVRVINPSSEVLIALSPERTYSTSGVRSFSPEQRQCYYNDEVKIAKFQQYSFHNCMAYQRVGLIKEYCDCIPISFPGEALARTCNFKDIDCMTKLEAHLSSDENAVKTSMQCLPECEHFDYPLEVALGELSSNVPLNGLPFFENVDLENRSVLNVFFNDLVSTRYRRDVYLNWQNILAAFGGLLSLMLGFTLISGFDLLIFFAFRIIYDCTLAVVKERFRRQNVIQIEEKKTDKMYAKKIGAKWKSDVRY